MASETTGPTTRLRVTRARRRLSQNVSTQKNHCNLIEKIRNVKRMVLKVSNGFNNQEELTFDLL